MSFKINADKYNYVSFDIFDTLLRRKVNNPIDVFNYIEKKYNCEGFAKKRVDAEKESNKRSGENTLDRIYETLYPKDVSLQEKWKKIEIKEEKALLVRNEEIINILDRYKHEKKKIILISDMYMDKNIIANILDEKEIYYDYLYVSSDIGKRKSRGDLYEFVLSDLKISSSDVVHIGDNFFSDYIIPRAYGIKSYYYKKRKFKRSTLNRSIIEALINNNKWKECKSHYFNIGYEMLGPLLWGFSTWLHNNCVNEELKRICFFSRDGYIMRKAYSFLYPKEDAKYVYFSRRSLTVPCLVEATSLAEIVEIVSYIKREENVHDFLHKIGIENEEIENEIRRKYGEVLYRDKLINDKYEGLFELINEPMKLNAQKERYACEAYMKNIFIDETVAMVDIGWYGTMEFCLNRLFKSIGMKKDIHSFYLGMIGGKYSSNVGKAYMFDGDRYTKEKSLLFGYNGLIETFFCANHGSVKKYILDSGKVSVVFEEWEKGNWQVVEDLHKGAMAFLEDLKPVLKNYNTNVLSSDASCNMWRLLTCPTNKEVSLFESVPFYDTYCNPLVKFDKSVNLFTLYKMKKNLLESNWKIGYIKKCFPFVTRPDLVYKIINLIKR